LTLRVKSSPARSRLEEEIELDNASFASLWVLTDGRRVVKMRYLIERDDATIELDVYHDALHGLMTAEVEFPDETASERFDAPSWFGREVTGDPRYANQALATEGIPVGDG
jgi:adenylate cyclase